MQAPTLEVAPQHRTRGRIVYGFAVRWLSDDLLNWGRAPCAVRDKPEEANRLEPWRVKHDTGSAAPPTWLASPRLSA